MFSIFWVPAVIASVWMSAFILPASFLVGPSKKAKLNEFDL